ncbi:MAG: inorganic phosphate transporter [Chloroflexi bacterium]|nr:inorganic phosphate transporter [Chloroflexota bacterium]MCL5026146.1 inorganic phosphate transporter [Chloroflexota bacterium]
MAESFAVLIIVICLAVAYDFVNGFHDTANAIATSISTRVLSPQRAILISASMNFVGALSGTAVAQTIGTGIVDPKSVNLSTLLAGLIAAMAWGLFTWYRGIPSSSSHALIFGIAGAAVATGGLESLVGDGLEKIVLSLLISPIIGFGGGLLTMVILLWLFRRSQPHEVNSIFRYVQIGSATFMAFSHGSNDAQKNMGVIATALVIYYPLSTFHVPLWVILLAATSMALGTAIGGWRIIKTMGTRITHLEPVQGFAAEFSAASVIEAGSRLGLPVSTTHTISTAIMGVGATRRLSAVRWGIAGDIFATWVLTIPATSVLAWATSLLLRALFS